MVSREGHQVAGSELFRRVLKGGRVLTVDDGHALSGGNQKAGRPSSAAAFRATDRAAAGLAAVTVRWPSCARGAGCLAVQMQVRARQGEHRSPVRRACAPGRCGPPQVAQQVEHHRRRVLARLHQRQACQRAHLQVEFGQVAGVDAAAPGVVRPRRHLVGHQEAAVGEHEELHTQHAHVLQRLGQATGQCDGLLREVLRHIRRRHLGDGQDAGAVQILLHRQVHPLPIPTPRDDDADLLRQIQALLQHTGHAAQRRECRRQLSRRGHHGLAFAVIAQAGGLEDARQQRCQRRVLRGGRGIY